MEEKSLDEQLDDILNGPLGQKLRHVHELKSKSYKAKIWANYDDAEKRRTIQKTKTLIDKVKSSSVWVGFDAHNPAVTFVAHILAYFTVMCNQF